MIKCIIKKKEISKFEIEILSKFETEMYEKYKNKIEPYVHLFDKEGLELKIIMEWYNNIQKEWAVNRLPLQNGYMCNIYCVVMKGGEEARIVCNDGEVDYYPMIAQWNISYISRALCKLKIEMFDDIDDDLEGDMMYLLSQVNNIC